MNNRDFLAALFDHKVKQTPIWHFIKRLATSDSSVLHEALDHFAQHEYHPASHQMSSSEINQTST